MHLTKDIHTFTIMLGILYFTTTISMSRHCIIHYVIITTRSFLQDYSSVKRGADAVILSDVGY